MKYIKLFKDTLSVLEDLTDEQSGQLFKAIVDYSNDKDTELSGLMVAVFSQFKIQIDNAKHDYNDVCERNKANGSKNKRLGATGLKNKPSEAKQPKDKDKDKDKEEYIYTYFFKKFSFINESSFDKLINHLKTKYSDLTKVRITNNIKKLKDKPDLFDFAVDEMVRLDFNGLFIPSNRVTNKLHIKNNMIGSLNMGASAI